MEIFDKEGLMIFPVPEHQIIRDKKKVLIVKECFCHKGHNLVTKHSKFNDFDGIELNCSNETDSGKVFLSPIYGEKNRVSLNITLNKGDILQLDCPHCNETLPTYMNCECGGDIITLFLDKEHSFSHIIGVCNRVDCKKSVLLQRGEILDEYTINNL